MSRLRLREWSPRLNVGSLITGVRHAGWVILAAMLVTSTETVAAQDTEPLFPLLTRALGGRSEPQAPKTLFRWNILDDGNVAAVEHKKHLVTDRPHIAEASALVGKGVLQIESGFTVFGRRENGSTLLTQSTPETLYRIGLFADWFEARIAYNSLADQQFTSTGQRITVRGSDDLYLGAKIALAEAQGVLPEVTIFPQMLVPSGSRQFTNSQVLPGFNLAYTWELSEVLELECNTQLNRRRDDVGHFYTEFLQVVNFQLELTEKLGAFTEFYCLVPNGALSALPQYYVHGGFVYLFTPNVQWDIHAASGLNKHSDAFFFGTGVSIRL